MSRESRRLICSLRDEVRIRSDSMVIAVAEEVTVEDDMEGNPVTMVWKEGIEIVNIRPMAKREWDSLIRTGGLGYL